MESPPAPDHSKDVEVALAQKDALEVLQQAAGAYATLGRKFVKEGDSFLTRLAAIGPSTQSESNPFSLVVNAMREINQKQLILLEQLMQHIMQPVGQIVIYDVKDLMDAKKAYDADQGTKPGSRRDTSTKRPSVHGQILKDTDAGGKDKAPDPAQACLRAAQNLMLKTDVVLSEQLCSYHHSIFKIYSQVYSLLKEIEPQVTTVEEAVQIRKAALPPVISFAPPPPVVRPILAEKRGFLLKKSKVKSTSRWVVVAGGSISWYKSDKETDSSGSISLLLSSLRQEPDRSFKVTCPEKSVVFQARTAQECDDWVRFLSTALSNAIDNQSPIPTAGNASTAGGAGASGVSTSLTAPPSAWDGRSSPSSGSHTSAKANERNAFKEITAAQKGNLVCADCGRKAPDWASITTGTIMCLDCSGIHRSLGVTVSKVRSLQLDKWEPATIDYMVLLGNDKVNPIWEAAIQEMKVTKPGDAAERSTKQMFITAKYTERLFIPKPEKPVPELHALLFEAALAHNLPMCLKLTLQGADPNWQNPAAGGSTLMHRLLDATQPHLPSVDFFMHRFRLDQPVVDEKGQSLLHVAARRNHVELVRYLLHRGARPALRDKSEQTPLDIALQLGHQEISDMLLAALSQASDAPRPSTAVAAPPTPSSSGYPPDLKVVKNPLHRHTRTPSRARERLEAPESPVPTSAPIAPPTPLPVNPSPMRPLPESVGGSTPSPPSSPSLHRKARSQTGNSGTIERPVPTDRSRLSSTSSSLGSSSGVPDSPSKERARPDK